MGRALPLVIATLLGAGGAGCSSVSVVEESTPVKVRLRKLAMDAPAFTSTWRVAPDHIEGRLDWQQCERESTWTTKRIRVSRRTGTRAAAAVMLGASSVATVAALATMPQPRERCGIYGCTASWSDSTPSKVWAASALALLTGGVVLWVVSSGAKVETLADEPKQASSTGPCLSPNELAELLLVLKVGQKRWPVRLQENGDVRVLVPEGTRVPVGVDLELVVFRAPSGAADLPLVRGQVLATLRLDPAPVITEAQPVQAEGTANFPAVPP
jgi:hypothetical protein